MLLFVFKTFAYNGLGIHMFYISYFSLRYTFPIYSTLRELTSATDIFAIIMSCNGKLTDVVCTLDWFKPVISNIHYIDYAEYRIPCLTRGRISTTCVVSLWTDDISCKYTFHVFYEKCSTKMVTLLGKGKIYVCLWYMRAHSPCIAKSYFIGNHKLKA